MSSEFLEIELPEMDSIYFYAYLFFAFLVASFLVYRSKSKFKLELLFLSFFLLGGNINDKLTFAIPGISFFEIQPDRFLFFLFSFFLFRHLVFPRPDVKLSFGWKMPWFKILLYLYALMVISSQCYHIYDLGLPEVITNGIYAINILLVMYCVRIIADQETIRIIGTSLVIGAVISSLVSIIQLGFDPMFLRVGDQRLAFGTTLRSNGLFINEYLNAYYIIIALAWVFVTYKKGFLKILLFGLFSLGVICAFQRMSWLILGLVTAIYFTQIEKIPATKLAASGLALCGVLILTFLMFRYEIMSSSLVRQRLSEPVNSRAGYYQTALNNVGVKPFFGFGGKDNETYYYSMLKITHDRDRALGITGDFHSGYFSTMFFYGLPAFLLFVGFVVSGIAYFGSLIRTNLIFAIPFLVALLYGIGNLTNTFLFSEYLTILYAIHLGLGQKLRELYLGSNEEQQLFASFTKV